MAEHNQSKRYGLVVIMEGRSFSPDGEQMREARQNLLNEVVLAKKGSLSKGTHSLNIDGTTARANALCTMYRVERCLK